MAHAGRVFVTGIENRLHLGIDDVPLSDEGITQRKGYQAIADRLNRDLATNRAPRSPDSDREWLASRRTEPCRTSTSR